MIIEDLVLVKNFKCFDENGAGFERILPINIIIGKNNSGKSSLLELVNYMTKNDYSILLNGKRGSINPEIKVRHTITYKDTQHYFGDLSFPHAAKGRLYKGRKISYKIMGSQQTLLGSDFESDDYISIFRDMGRELKSALSEKKFCYIAAERDILPEESEENIKAQSNGAKATSLIQQIITSTRYDRDLVEKDLLLQLNKIVNPDIKFKRILVQKHHNKKWEIYFEDLSGQKIPLSKMGSGIKTIILVLIYLIIQPKIDELDKNKYVFAFEELENNLHPALQRRLYNYIKEYSEKHNTFFFLTTHSNVVIDSFSKYEKAQFIHVENDGNKSTTRTISTHNDVKIALDDIGVKASDILQSNGIIWVEGPSDRNYINKWLEIKAPEFQENLHYSIMFYGGRLLSNLTFDFEWIDEKLIPLLKINKNSYVIIDRDGKKMTTRINDTKKRIINEIGNENYWITKGREIENYLSNETISNWLKVKHGITGTFTNDKNEKLENNISVINKSIKFKYNSSKTKYSDEIKKFITSDSLKELDLEQKLNQLIENIKKWNK